VWFTYPQFFSVRVMVAIALSRPGPLESLMKLCKLKAVVLVLIFTNAGAQSDSSPRNHDSSSNLPRTVEEAVQAVKTKWISASDREWILRNPKEDVVLRLYRPFGTAVRNEFGLWGENQALRDSCEDNHPEGCSVVILNRLWESVRADADPALVRALDCQFQLAEAVRIDTAGFEKLTTGKLLKALQAQIDKQMAALPDACQDSLSLGVEGKPDKSCFVSSPFEKGESDKEEKTTLRRALAVLGSRNLFRVSHTPPTITLTFARECQFTRPPRY
jgi:hypothetical protein